MRSEGRIDGLVTEIRARSLTDLTFFARRVLGYAVHDLICAVLEQGKPVSLTLRDKYAARTHALAYIQWQRFRGRRVHTDLQIPDNALSQWLGTLPVGVNEPPLRVTVQDNVLDVSAVALDHVANGNGCYGRAVALDPVA